MLVSLNCCGVFCVFVKSASIFKYKLINLPSFLFSFATNSLSYNSIVDFIKQMSSGVSDRLKRQAAAGKLMEECDAIPWSQQVDEAYYENLSSPIDKKVSEYKAKSNRTYYCNEFKKSEDSCVEKKKNIPNVSYNTKKDNVNVIQKISSRDTQKVVFGVTSIGKDEDKQTGNYSSVDDSSTANDSNLNKKQITWASVASQPAKPNQKNNNILLKKKGPGMPPPPMIPGKHNLDINAWDFSSNVPPAEISGSFPISIPISEQTNLIENDESITKPSAEHQSTFNRKQPNFYSNKPIKHAKTNIRALDISRDRRYIQKHNEEQNTNSRQANTNCISNLKETVDDECNERNIWEKSNAFSNVEASQPETKDSSHIVLKKLKDRNNYNPTEIDMQKAALSRFFVIKSYSEDDIHRSIKYEIWCSTDHGNKRLDEAFKERVKEDGNVMLFFSVNGSGHFCGMAQMMTSVDYNSTSSVWSQDKWKGKFKVKWIYVKDVPNSQLRHIRLENNDNKSVTNSRDTQEVPTGKGLQVLRVLHLYKHQTSIFDDFYHYEKKQEEAVSKKPTQLDNYVHASSSSNAFHHDVKPQTSDRFSGNFRERIISHRGGNHNFTENRRYSKPMEIQPSKDEKIADHLNQDREDNETDTYSLQRHTNSCVENYNTSSKRNSKDIILHMNNLTCNEHNIVGENSESKLL